MTADAEEDILPRRHCRSRALGAAVLRKRLSRNRMRHGIVELEFQRCGRLGAIGAALSFDEPVCVDGHLFVPVGHHLALRARSGSRYRGHHRSSCCTGQFGFGEFDGEVVQRFGDTAV
jgi:hypothetical protein